MITRCPNCSKAISESDDICPFCGKDFSVPVAPKRPKSFAPKEEAPPPPPPKEETPPPPPPPPRPARILTPTGWEEVTEDGLVVPPSPDDEPKPIGKNIAVAAAFLAIAFGLWRGSAYLKEKPASNGLEAPPPPISMKPPEPKPPEREVSSISLILAPDKPPAPKPQAPAKTRIVPAPGASGSQGPRGKDVLLSRAAPAKKEPLEEVVILEHTPPTMREWGFSGSVFDLMTLKPVPDAELIFTDPGSGRRFPISTDKEGRYRMVLPACLDGYDMTVSHPKYEPKYIADGDPPLKSLPPAERRKISVESGLTIQHKEMFSPGPNGQLKRDLALIPLTTH